LASIHKATIKTRRQNKSQFYFTVPPLLPPSNFVNSFPQAVGISRLIFKLLGLTEVKKKSIKLLTVRSFELETYGTLATLLLAPGFQTSVISYPWHLQFKNGVSTKMRIGEGKKKMAVG